MTKQQYILTTIEDYPENGKHQEVFIGLPFRIRKGEDGYFYRDKKGVEKKYNLFKDYNKVDDRWICHLTEWASPSLEDIFEIKTYKSLDSIIEYCVKLYKKSLKLELKRLQDELSDYV